MAAIAIVALAAIMLGQPAWADGDTGNTTLIGNAEALIAAGDQRAAIAVLETAVGADERDVRSRRLLLQLYLWNQRAVEAVPILEDLVDLVPDDETLKRDLAQHYVWNQRAADAAPLLADLLDHHPGDLELVARLAEVYEWTEQGGKAIPLLARLVAANPEDAALRLRLARQWLAKEHPDRALEHLRVVVKAQPEDLDARFLLAQVCHWRDDCWPEAATQYDAILARQSDHLEARRYRRRLRVERGPRLTATPEGFRDSNQMQRLGIVTRFDMPMGAQWRLWAQYGHRQLSEPDGVANVELQTRQNTVSAALGYRISNKTWIEAGAGAEGFSTGSWVPTINAAVKTTLWTRLYPQLSYRYEPYTASVRAIHQQLHQHALRLSAYAEPTTDVTIGAAMEYGRLSDGNRRITGYGMVSYTVVRTPVRIGPKITVGYDDFADMNPTAVPYYTPQNALVVAPGAEITYKPVPHLDITGGYALAIDSDWHTYQQIRAALQWDVTMFDQISAAYAQSGSAAYRYQLLTFSYQHRF